MLDPLTNVHEELAIIRRPFPACFKCEFYETRGEIERWDEGPIDRCNLEYMCRNAVHIAWMSLTAEEKEEFIKRQSEPSDDGTREEEEANDTY